MSSQSSGGASSALGLLYVLLPVLLVVLGVFFFHDIFVHNRVNKTVDEIIGNNKQIKFYFNGVYKGFNNAQVIGHNILSFETKASETDYAIQNRFGGQVVFYEAFNNSREKLLYISLLDNLKKYDELYNGVTSYAVLYTGLSRKECRLLAQIDWRKYANNFVGIEVSNLTSEEKFNGIQNLRLQLLQDKDIYELQTKDNGFVSAEPLTSQQAETNCSCSFWNDTCTVALKFN